MRKIVQDYNIKLREMLPATVTLLNSSDNHNALTCHEQNEQSW